MDLSSQDLEHDELANAVRTYTASQLYDFIEGIRPQVKEIIDEGLSDNLSRILATTQVMRAYLAALKDLGKLYQLDKPPIQTEEMVPAASVPLMIEAAVNAEVGLAVEEALRLEREDKATAQRVSASEAKDRVRSVLGEVGRRSVKQVS